MWESLSGALSMALVFFPFFQFDQFLVLKKKKAKKREMELYRKRYQCFCCLHLPYVCILPSLRVSPLASV